MALSVVNHRLEGEIGGKPVAHETSTNHNGPINPKLVVFHYTACSFDAARAAFLRTSGSNRVSAHLMVDADGSVTQFVPLNLRAWHAGESTWETLADINSHSIGIEVVNYGYLLKTASGGFRLSDGRPAPLAPDDVVETRHKRSVVPYLYWHGFTPAQVEACGALAETLAAAYPIQDVVGHDDIAPQRKVDPGPAFPLARMRSRALSREAPAPAADQWMLVAASKLNIRRGPGEQYDLAASPLPRNTRVRVNGRQEGWISVDVPDAGGVSGWVAARYLSA